MQNFFLIYINVKFGEDKDIFTRKITSTVHKNVDLFHRADRAGSGVKLALPAWQVFC